MLTNTFSAETLLPVHKSVHKNTDRLAFDHCQTTDPDPAPIGIHSVFSNDGPQSLLHQLILDKYQYHKLLLEGNHTNYFLILVGGKTMKMTLHCALFCMIPLVQ